MIDVDDAATWPESVRAWVDDHVDASNVRLLEDEPELRSLLGGEKLLAFHCTRLLAHEVEWLRGSGLRVLTVELVEARIEAAHEHGFLDAAERESLLQSNVFAIGQADNRRDQVALILGRGLFDDDPGGCEPLLSTWGGEGIYFFSEEHEPHLRTLGKPAIVAAQINLSVPLDTCQTHPGLGGLFVAAVRGSEKLSADVFHRAPVPANDVLDVWQPGHPEYDRHWGLPR